MRVPFLTKTNRFHFGEVIMKRKQLWILGGLITGAVAMSMASGGCSSTGQKSNTNTPTRKPSSTPVPTATLAPAVPFPTPAGNYIVVIGGEHANSTSVPDVLYAPINANGSIGTWSVGANALPTPRGTAGTYDTSSMWIAKTNGNYLVYGSPGTPNGGGYYSFYSYVNSSQVTSGVPGTWTIGVGADAGATPVYGSAWNQAVTDGSFIYNIDSFTGLGNCNVYPVTAGVVGAVDDTQPGIGSALVMTPMVYANGYLFTLGGRTSSATISTVYTARINAPGVVGTWSTSTVALPSIWTRAESQAMTIVMGSSTFVYVVGGYNGSATQSTVYYDTVDASGNLGAWSTTTALPTAFEWGVALPYRNASGTYIAAIGGETSYGNPPLSTTYYAPVNSNGTLGTWTTGPALPNGGLIFANGAVF